MGRLLGFGLAAVLVAALSGKTAAAGDDSPAKGAAKGPSSSVLTAYYRSFLEDRELERFRQNVQARYSQKDLQKLVTGSEKDTRRAAVLALGLVGTFDCNEALAQGLKDEDAVVRSLTEGALWGVWFRGGTADQNERLELVREAISEGNLENAQKLATQLIAEAPEYAEAYNQRAIVAYAERRFEESVEDCQRVLELNPYHIGALSGMGQCYMQLGKKFEALAVFRRALEASALQRGFEAGGSVVNRGGSLRSTVKKADSIRRLLVERAKLERS